MDNVLTIVGNTCCAEGKTKHYTQCGLAISQCPRKFLGKSQSDHKRFKLIPYRSKINLYHVHERLGFSAEVMDQIVNAGFAGRFLQDLWSNVAFNGKIFFTLIFFKDILWFLNLVFLLLYYESGKKLLRALITKSLTSHSHISTNHS